LECGIHAITGTAHWRWFKKICKSFHQANCFPGRACSSRRPSTSTTLAFPHHISLELHRACVDYHPNTSSFHHIERSEIFCNLHQQVPSVMQIKWLPFLTASLRTQPASVPDQALLIIALYRSGHNPVSFTNTGVSKANAAVVLIALFGPQVPNQEY